MRGRSDVMVWVGAGVIGMAIARRLGAGMKIVVGDIDKQHAESAVRALNGTGFDAVARRVDLGSRESIMSLIAFAREFGEIKMLVNAGGVSPSQASVEKILQVDLYGTAVLLEEVGKVIGRGGVGVTISSQSSYRMPALSPEEDMWLACTPCEDLLKLTILQPENIRDSLHAYQLAKRCNQKRVMSEAVKWGRRGARVNAISPGIIMTPLALDEFNGPRGGFYKNMFANAPAGRPGIGEEVANVAELVMTPRGAFVTGSDFLIDGGATASFYYGGLRPDNAQKIRLYLTSSPFGIYREEGGACFGLNPRNGLVDALKSEWPEKARCLLIAASPDEHGTNVGMAREFAQRLKESGLEVSAFDVCDACNPEAPVKHLTSYDFVLLAGGHVPTQNAFFEKIGLFERIRDYDGIVMGVSAGSMNCAKTVYAQPELPGEACDAGYRRFMPGLGLTYCQILPHYQSVKDDVLDGMRLFEDITYGDSRGNAFIAIPDGSFVLQRDGLPVLHGEGYLITEGRIEKICEDGETQPLD